MNSSPARRFLAAVGLATVLATAGSALGASPAHAGGGDAQHYVYGATKTACTNNLNASIRLYRDNGYQVTGVNGCRLTGDRTRYFGDFYAYMS